MRWSQGHTQGCVAPRASPTARSALAPLCGVPFLLRGLQTLTQLLDAWMILAGIKASHLPVLYSRQHIPLHLTVTL